MQCQREGCNNEFTPKNKQQKYCQEECTPSYIAKQLRLNRTRETIKCKTCGNEFVPTNSSNVYCKAECRPIKEWTGWGIYGDTKVDSDYVHPDVMKVLTEYHKEWKP